jgi:anti-anti-sigma factor
MLQVCEPQDRLTLAFDARMDTAKCEQVNAQVRAAVTAPGKPVVFDLNGVEFVSSAFLSLCIFAHQQAGGHGFRVVNVGPFVKRVFKIAGLDRMLGDE